MEMMKTADQMLEYCDTYETDGGSILNRNRRHFEILAEELQQKEYAVCAFTGLMNGFNYAFAITDERIIYAQKKVVGMVVKAIYLKNINDVTTRKGPLHGFVQIDTLKEKFEFCVAADYADSIRNCIRETLESYQNREKKQTNVTGNSSIADEIIKFKQLMDSGVISEEEFETKKKQLLSL